jgi:hypothetical protein
MVQGGHEPELLEKLHGPIHGRDIDGGAHVSDLLQHFFGGGVPRQVVERIQDEFALGGKAKAAGSQLLFEGLLTTHGFDAPTLYSYRL